MRRKGISPLIAAVLLIAFTLAVAALLTAWVTTFTQDTTGAVGDESERLIDCSYAGLAIFDVSYTGDSGDDTFITVENTGTTELGNITYAALSDGAVLADNTADESATPGPGEVAEFSLDVDEEPGEVRVSSTACPEISDRETSITTG